MPVHCRRWLRGRACCRPAWWRWPAASIRETQSAFWRPTATEVARGISAYSDADVARIMGRKSAEIAGILGYRSGDALVHRDDLVILRKDWQAAPAQEAS